MVRIDLSKDQIEHKVVESSQARGPKERVSTTDLLDTSLNLPASRQPGNPQLTHMLLIPFNLNENAEITIAEEDKWN